MHNINKLKVYALARQNLKEIRGLESISGGFGDLINQMQRAAISVVSNIAEGAGSSTDKQFLRFLSYAKASNTELLSQMNILSDIGRLSSDHELFKTIDHVGAMLAKLMRHLSG